MKDENPENWEWIRTSILLKDGVTWAHEDKSRKVDTLKIRSANEHWTERHHYLYINAYGTNQSCMAVIHVEEREWLHKPTGKSKVCRDICVAFEGQLGTEADSWKGGVVGCNFEMLPYESPLDTLRRMEKTRSFN